MHATDERTVSFEAIETLVEGAVGALVLGRDVSGGEVVAFVPASPAMAERERIRLADLAGPGIPEVAPATCAPGDGPSRDVVLLSGLSGARPLHRWGALPAPALRSAAVTLLSTLSHAHSKGLVHGAVGRGWVVADGEGRHWIAGWSQARAPERSPEFGATPDAAAGDLGDLGRTLLRAALGSPWPDPAEMAPGEVREATARLAATDRELARVLTRLATTDPREVYGGASEALSDLGSTDLSLAEPWEDLRFTGRRRHVEAAMRRLATAGTPSGRVASIDFVGGTGSGKSRLLREVARAARTRGAIVFSGEGRVAGQGFGALGALVRQLAAHVPPESPVRGRHAATLDRLLEGPGAAPRAAPNEEAGLVSALVDLVRAAAGEGSAVLAIDDAHLLPRTASEAWRALGRYVDAVGDAEGPLRVLLVTTTESDPVPEPGVRRERRELADWGRLHVHSLLAHVLTEKGAAAVLAADVHRLAGGRPREVVDLLRDLERRGALVPAGRRWRWVEGRHVLEATAVADRVRRALEAVGRDGAAVVEAVAAADRLRLHRDELAELSGVPSHRVPSAAEVAVRAGLLVRHGSGWRVRAESLRRRIETSMTTERRRGLHREVVARLLETRPEDLPALAFHARRAGDPRALEWTRVAARALRAAGSPVEAAEHLEEAVAECGLGTGPEGWRDLIVVADALVDAGLSAKAESVVDGLLRDPRCPPSSHADAVLVKARALRIDNRFYALSVLELPAAGGAPPALARLRYYRAGGLAMVGRTADAEREIRLAAAELSSSAESEAVEYERLQAHHLLAFAAGDRPAAHRHLVALLRHPRARASRFDQARFLAARANLCRIDRDLFRATVWLTSARRTALRMGSPPALMAAIDANRGIVASELNRGDSAIRCWESAHAFALRGFNTTTANAHRLRLACGRTVYSGCVAEDRAFAIRVSSAIQSLDAESKSALCERLSYVLFELNLQERLEALACHAPQAACRVMRARCSAGRMALDIWDGNPEATLHVPRSDSCVEFEQLVLGHALRSVGLNANGVRAAVFVSSLASIAIAWLVRAHATSHSAALWEWINETVIPVVAENSRKDWGDVDLECTLALVGGGNLKGRQRIQLVNSVLGFERPLPPAASWRRELLRVVESARAGRIADARRFATRTEQLIGLLENDDFGKLGGVSAIAARRFYERIIQSVHPLLGMSTKKPLQMAVRDLAGSEGRCERTLADAWRAARAQVDGSQRAVVISRHARDLERFAAQLVEGRPDGWVFDVTGSTAPAREATGVVVIHVPNLWPEDVATEAYRRIAPIASAARVIALLTCSEGIARERSPGHRALLDLATGTVVALPAPTERIQDRPALFTGVLRAAVEGGALDGDAAAEITGYDWPGGIGEMENVVGELRRRGVVRVSVESLRMIGWRERVSLAEATQLPELQRRLLGFMGREGTAGIRDLIEATGRPSRTVLRAVSELVASGRLERTGKGRATRYRIGTEQR